MADFRDPFTIKNVTVRNRIAIPPMVCFYWPKEDGYVTEKNIKHYRDLAAGGAGLIIVEATAITRRGKLHDTELGIWEDGQIEGLKKIVDVIHENGAKAFIQLVHAGANGPDPEAEAPSAVEYRPGFVPKEMTIERIRETEEDFVKASVRAKKAGFDGVELHGCHGYLLSCFMSKKYNLRTDEYGRDRTLITRETLQKVKAAVGEDYIVGIRFGIFEPEFEDGIANARKVAPYTDFFDISYGIACKGFAPEGFKCSEAIYGASLVKKEFPDMPVFGVHNVNSKEDVENALETGIDMVDVGKASLVDPAFAGHLVKGEPYGKCLHCRNYCRWNPWEMANPDKVCPGFVNFNKIK